MHVYHHCRTIHNSKDMESTQMPTSDRLDKENVVCIHHWILCSHKQEWDHVLCRDIDGAWSHYPEHINTGTENQTPHVLTYKWELKSENPWTLREEQTLGPVSNWRVGGGRGPEKIPIIYYACYLDDELICTKNLHDMQFTYITNLHVNSRF